MTWKLIFNEHFANLDNWVFDIGSGEQGLWGNHEKEFYTSDPKNCFVRDNQLYIISRKERKGDCEYTSARLKTLGKFAFKHGYVEVSAKLPTGNGSWPAIWMMGVNHSWPRCGEIDILEHLGRDPDVIHHAIHSASRVCDPRNTFMENLPGATKSFHQYGLLWQKSSIEFYVDRKPVGKIEKSENYSSTEDWPLDDYFYLLINCAVGGDWAGEIVDDDLPFEYIIDYVKIWQEHV